MKTLVLGHGHHGKDTVAELIVAMYGLSFKSSSEEVFLRAVWPKIGSEYIDCDLRIYDITEDRRAKKECYEDRRNRREEWRQLIRDYNTPDAARLAKEITAEVDIYVGMRDDEEYAECVRLGLFDRILWVSRPGYVLEPSMKIVYDPSAMTPIINIETPDEARRHALLRDQLRKVFG